MCSLTVSDLVNCKYLVLVMTFPNVRIVEIQNLPNLRIKEKADFEPAFSLDIFRVCYYLLQNGNEIRNVQTRLYPRLPCG